MNRKNLILLIAMNVICKIAFSQNTTDVVIVSPTGFTESENSVFISPLNNTIILNSNNRRDLSASPTLDVDAATSSNSGFGWTDRGALSNSITDPAVVIDRNGYYYVMFVTPLTVSKSTDNGASWTNTTVNNENADKDHLWVDNKVYKANGSSNSYQGYLHAAYRNTSTANINATSYDNTNWSTAVSISSGFSSYWHQGANVQTGPDPANLSQMNVYACWGMHINGSGGEKNEVAIGFNKSSDGGQSWGSASKIIDNISGIPAFHALGTSTKKMHVNSFPSMTVNPQNGYIFIVWSNYSDNCSPYTFPRGCTQDPDIYMLRSVDGGANWDSPVKVNQDDSTDDDQWFPWIACDEASGALVCVYYDSRLHSDSVNTYVSISYDQGGNWTDTRISDVSWNGNPPNANYGSYAGDYIGVDVYHGKAVPVWTDARTASPYTGRLLSFTNPFDVSCPSALDLVDGNYYITDEGSNFTYDAAYSTSSTINVSGSPSSYKIYSGANVLMTAATSITLNDGFECNGEFTADISSCPGGNFSQRANGNEPSNEVNTQGPSPFALVKNNFPVSVYPNPSSNGKLQSYIPLVTSDEADTHNPKPAYIFVYNSMGEMVYSKQATDWISELDLSGQPAGFYLMKVTKGDKIYSGKIILK